MSRLLIGALVVIALSGFIYRLEEIHVHSQRTRSGIIAGFVPVK